MCRNKKNNFYHGIMFHHFFDKKKYKPSQGSISKKNLFDIVKYVGEKNVLDPSDFLKKLKNNSLKKNHVCLTFDDGLKCHYDIVVPILNKLKIKAFFFIYTSIFNKKPNLFECYRYFRVTYFKNINQFYKEFYSSLIDNKIKVNLEKIFFSNKNKIYETKKLYPFYSLEDIKFRLIRDNYISHSVYNKIMISMFRSKKFKYKKFNKLMFMSKANVKKLYKEGHMIGLHSHTHPVNMGSKTLKSQYLEFKKNKDVLRKILNNNIISASYPLGQYNRNTIKVFKKLNISISFRDSMNVDRIVGSRVVNCTNLQIAREDSANILPRIK